MMSLRGLLILVALAGCNDAPLSYSAPVGIHLKAKSGDTAGGVISEDKSITTESGNPFGAFISDAKQKLDGKDPGTVTLRSVDLLLGASSTNVTKLGEVFAGTVDALFEIDDTNNTYPAASGAVSASTDAGPKALDPAFERPALPDFDYLKFLGGSFKVVLRGPAAADFSTKGADADLQVTFMFEAFE